MSNYNKIIPTLSGNNLLVESIKSKKPLIFTKIALGDGALQENENIENLTALKRQMCENTVQDVKNKGNGELDIIATISNASVTSGFYARELGVFAKVGDNGQEKLFGYTNAGAQASYTPAGTSLDEKLITVTFYVGNDVNVKISLNSQLYITQGALDQHNESMNAHAELLRRFFPLTGGEVNGDVIIKNHLFKIKNANNKEMLIRFNADNSLDIGNAYNGDGINGISLCSIIRPGWYNGSGSTKGFALSEELEPIKTLLGQGAIVSSKLDERSGFIKFANGFTIQWGSSGDDNSAKSTVTYPIAFKRVFISCAIDAFWGGASVPKYLANSANESTNTKAVFVGNDQYVGSYHWFAFGMA